MFHPKISVLVDWTYSIKLLANLLLLFYVVISISVLEWHRTPPPLFLLLKCMQQHCHSHWKYPVQKLLSFIIIIKAFFNLTQNLLDL